MYKNYLKIAIRSLLKNKTNSFINIFGLALAIGICVLAYAFARWTYDTDQFHEHKNEVFLVTFVANRAGSPQQYGITPRPLAEMLRSDFTHIKKVCRVDDRNVIMKSNDNLFHERLRCVDPEFLEMLTFPLKWGSPASLRDGSSMVISEEMSLKYFGDINPVGLDVLVKFDEKQSKLFRITGVAAKFPAAKTIEFDFLVNFQNIRIAEPSYNPDDWTQFISATLIQLDHASDLNTLATRMDRYRKLQNAAVDEEWKISSFVFEALATLHKHSSSIKDDISRSSDAQYESILFLAILSIFMLALACFNYINIAIVSAAKRLKEIGIRKTIGATRRIIVIQFLLENILVTFCALVGGMALGGLVFIPWLENLNDFSLGFTVFERHIWIFLASTLLLTGVASGLYPSLYISHFQVVRILKGSVRFGSKNFATKVLLVIQLILACILITAGVTFRQNSDYMSTRSWGYNQQDAIYISIPDYGAFEKLEARMLREPRVLSVSGSQHHLGKSTTRTVVNLYDHQIEVDELAVDPAYFETMGIKLVDGRLFRKHYENDTKTIVVTETFVKDAGIPTPIGNTLKIDSVQYEIIGIVEDFHTYNFFRKMNPTIFRIAEQEKYKYLSLRTAAGSGHDVVLKLKWAWANLYPEIPFDGGYQEDTWGRYFDELSIHAKVWKAFASVAILLAAMGMYGLVTLNVTGRVKEFSVRKVLGANIFSIAGNVLSQYVVLYLIALSIGAPVSYFLIKLLFDLIYVYHMPITVWVVIIAISLLVIVMLSTMSSQIVKAAKANPVEGLKE